MLLITGATGYLGRVLLARLAAEGAPVRATVREPARAAALPPGVEWRVAGLDDPAALRRAARGCTAVVHLAAAIGGSPEVIRALNVGGTEAVLDAARAAGVRRVVHASSSAAIVDATGLVSERAGGGTALTDPYSVTKAEAERLALAASGPSGSGPTASGPTASGPSGSGPGLEVVVVNPVSVYGPSPAGPSGYNGLFEAAAAGEVDEVVDAPIGWVLAGDVAHGLLLALRGGEPGRRYVLCGEVAPFGAVLNRYAELVGSPHRVRTVPPGTALGPDASTFARRSEVYGKLGPVRVEDRAARALGFAPTGLAAGLAATAAWLHPDAGRR